MRIIFWNIRGIGKKARIRQLKDMMAKEKTDIIGLQETIKQGFQDFELHDFSNGVPFCW